MEGCALGDGGFLQGRTHAWRAGRPPTSRPTPGAAPAAAVWGGQGAGHPPTPPPARQQRCPPPGPAPPWGCGAGSPRSRLRPPPARGLQRAARGAAACGRPPCPPPPPRRWGRRAGPGVPWRSRRRRPPDPRGCRHRDKARGCPPRPPGECCGEGRGGLRPALWVPARGGGWSRFRTQPCLTPPSSFTARTPRCAAPPSPVHRRHPRS